LPSCLTISSLCLETKSEGCRSWCRREKGGEIRSSPGVRTRSLPVPKVIILGEGSLLYPGLRNTSVGIQYLLNEHVLLLAVDASGDRLHPGVT
ncbi:unnamed protein product, partial [Musa hybrid cultivar]